MGQNPRPLGMRRPKDDEHIRLYGLTAETYPTVPTPVCIGVNWYSGFDNPDWSDPWIGRGDVSQWGAIRGGHEVCLSSPHVVDNDSWWKFYDQGTEGACVGFAFSRMMSNLNRLRYDALWLYHEAQKVDDWPGEDYDGTSGRAAADVLRDVGHQRFYSGKSRRPASLRHGIDRNRWAKSVEDIARCLSPRDEGAVVLNRGYAVILNSWGAAGYPHFTKIPLESLHQLIFVEDGDATMVTDR